MLEAGGWQSFLLMFIPFGNTGIYVCKTSSHHVTRLGALNRVHCFSVLFCFVFFWGGGVVLHSVVIGDRVRAQGHFQIGPTEEGTGSAVSAAEVKSTGVLDRMGDSQSAGFPVLAQRRLSIRKGTGHVSRHHSLVAQQILEGTKIAALSVGTPHTLATVTARHELFPQAFLAQSARSHSQKNHTLMESRENKKRKRPRPDQRGLYIKAHGTHGWRQPDPLPRHGRAPIQSCTCEWSWPQSCTRRWSCQKLFVYDWSLEVLILAQNWPKTAKSSWHCSFERKKFII